MINFEEELKRFSPIPEVNQAEEAIYSNDLKDISDIVLQMTPIRKAAIHIRTILFIIFLFF